MATYYLKNGGNDGAAGTSDETAWASITKLEGEFSPGDSILLKCGDTWQVGSNIDIASSGTAVAPIVIGSYGSGEKPILTTWYVYAGGTWEEGSFASSGNITSVANSAISPGVKTTCTSNAHGMSNGAIICVSGNYWYLGTYAVSNVTENTFDITKVYGASYPTTATYTYGWSASEGTNIWRNSFSPLSVGNRCKLGNTTETMKSATINEVAEDLKWTQDTDYKLYVYATQNPITEYTATGGIQKPWGAGYLFSIENHDYITIHGIEMVGGGTSTIWLNNCNGMDIHDCKFSEKNAYTIRADYLTNSNIYDNDFDTGYAVDYVMEWSQQNNAARSVATMNGADDIGLWRGCQNNNIYGNTFTNFQHGAISLYCSEIGSTDTNDDVCNNRIYSNHFIVTKAHYNRVGGTQGETNKCYNNYWYDNLIDGQSVRTQILGNNNYYYNNIFINSQKSEFYNGGRSNVVMFEEYNTMISQNNYFVHNIIVGGWLEGIWMSTGSCDYSVVANNIIMNCGEDGSNYQIKVYTLISGTAISINNNICYPNIVRDGNTTRTVAEFDATSHAWGDADNNIGEDPLLNTNYTPKSTSPAINAGYYYSFANLDYAGRTRGNPPDIGAYEWVGAILKNCTLKNCVVH